MLRIGRIDYLNVWPLFQGLQSRMEPELQSRVRLVAGHPSELNAALASGELDIAPSSSFEYLIHADRYALLPDLSISARGPVRSVFLVCPFPLQEMPKHLAAGLQVGLSTASASSVALLRALWKFHWKLPEPDWISIGPGTGLYGEIPFLEIGDLALRLTCDLPQGWHLIDLGREWMDFTNLPFVFGVWMVRRNLPPDSRQCLGHVVNILQSVAAEFARDPVFAARQVHRPDWLRLEVLEEYWHCIRYGFGPREQAGLILFADYIRQLGLISAVPGLTWSTPQGVDQP